MFTFSKALKSTVMDLVSYRKQGVVGVDLASRGKYSYGPRFVPKAGGRGGGSRFARKVQLWTSFRFIPKAGGGIKAGEIKKK